MVPVCGNGKINEELFRFGGRGRNMNRYSAGILLSSSAVPQKLH